MSLSLLLIKKKREDTDPLGVKWSRAGEQFWVPGNQHHRRPVMDIAHHVKKKLRNRTAILQGNEATFLCQVLQRKSIVTETLQSSQCLIKTHKEHDWYQRLSISEMRWSQPQQLPVHTAAIFYFKWERSEIIHYLSLIVPLFIPSLNIIPPFLLPHFFALYFPNFIPLSYSLFNYLSPSSILTLPPYSLALCALRVMVEMSRFMRRVKFHNPPSPWPWSYKLQQSPLDSNAHTHAHTQTYTHASMLTHSSGSSKSGKCAWM